MKSLSTDIYLRPSYEADEDIHFAVGLTNNSRRTIYFKGDITSAFEIDGIAYGNATPDNNKKKETTLSLPAGKTILKKITLSTKGKLVAGDYSLNLHFDRLKVGTSREGKINSRTKQVIRNSVTVCGPQKTPDTKEKVTVRMSLFGRADFRELFQPELLHRALPEGLVPPRPCRVIGGSDQQRDSVRIAHEDGYVLAVDTLVNLRNDALYQRWFGLVNGERFRFVQETLRLIVDGFRNEQFTYDLQREGCRPGDIALSAFRHLNIKICPAFWQLPPRGQDSMASRIFHEHSHASADMRDTRNQFQDCLNLARQDPARAIRCASNYQFYAEE